MPRWVLVARILRPRGNKGEVAAEVLTDFPHRLTRLTEVYLGKAEGVPQDSPQRVAVRSCWLSQNHRGQAVFHFAGCDSIADAEKFRGLDVLLPLEERVSLPAGQYFVSDLIGCSVFDSFAEERVVSSSPCSLARAPELLGAVRDVYFPGEGVTGTPLLCVDTAQGELLIPLAEDICTNINVSERRIDVVLPPGLRTLNEPE
jgi:16S rRNA processing protein RimM